MQHSYLQLMLVLDTVLLRKSYLLATLDFILAQLSPVPSVCVFSLVFPCTTMEIRQTPQWLLNNIYEMHLLKWFKSFSS